MGLSVTAGFDFSSRADRGASMPDPAAFPEIYEGVLWRRVLAYGLDLICIGVIAVIVWVVFAVLWLLSFGLLGPLLWFLFGLIPLAYHTLLLERSPLGDPRHARFRPRACARYTASARASFKR